MGNASDANGLCDLLDRLLDVGAVVKGSVVISIADVEMIYIELAVLIAAADRVLDRPPNPKQRLYHETGPH